jgi:surface protein
MTIIEKIKQSVEGATGMPFLYHAAGELNELIARCSELPVAYSFLIDSGTIDDVNGRYHERVTLAVMFCDKTEFDFNALENEQIIDRMKVKAYKWMHSLRMSNALHVVSVNNTQRLYDNTTDILTGFAVNITIEDVAGVGECELPDVVIDVDKNGSYDVVGVDKVRVNVVPKLEELEVTQNGEYTPQEGVDGFSKVVANVVPTKKVVLPSIFQVTNTQVIDGYWAGELVDTSFITDMQQSFTGCSQLQSLDVSNWDTSKVTNMSNMFQGCSQLQNLDVSNWDTSKVTNMARMFNSCSQLQSLDVSNWDTSSVTTMRMMFNSCSQLQSLDVSNWDTSSVTTMYYLFNENSNLEILDLTKWDLSNIQNAQYNNADGVFINCRKLKSIIGGKTIEDVLANNISALYGYNGNGNICLPYTIIDRASLRAVINGLADLTGQTAKILALGNTLIAKLTEEDIAIATNKNWTIV